MVNLHRLGGFCSVRLNISKGNVVHRRSSNFTVNSFIGYVLCGVVCNAFIKNCGKSGETDCGVVLLPVDERITVAVLVIGIGNGGGNESIAEMIGLISVIGNRITAVFFPIIKGYGIFVIGLFKNGNVFRVGSDGEVLVRGNANKSIDCVGLIARCACAEVAVFINDISVLLFAVSINIIAVSVFDIVSVFIGLIFNLVPTLKGIGEVVIRIFFSFGLSQLIPVFILFYFSGAVIFIERDVVRYTGINCIHRLENGIALEDEVSD